MAVENPPPKKNSHHQLTKLYTLMPEEVVCSPVEFIKS